MPTKDNCALLENLIEATSSLVEMKKQVDRIDHEIRVAQERLANRNAENGDKDAEGDAEMDVDEEEVGGEVVGSDGRAHSVMSTRSGRGTKPPRKVRTVMCLTTACLVECSQLRRSVSISSVDTSATGSVKRKRM